MSDLFFTEVKEFLLQNLTEYHPEFAQISQEEIEKNLEVPPQFQLGQLAFPTFLLAKSLKTAPAAISQKLHSFLTTVLQEKPLAYPLIEKIEPIGPYLNFFIQFENLAQKIFATEHFFHPIPTKAEEKIIVEYSQPNTHKALHIGHLRGLVLGDALANLLSYAGFSVEKVTYPGDIGTHVAKTIWYLLAHPEVRKTAPQAHESAHTKADWLGDIYAEVEDAIQSHPLGEKTVWEEIGKILRDISHKNSTPAYQLWLETRQWSLDSMQALYDWFHVKFDRWFTESECDLPSIELVKQKFQEGFFTLSDGAIGKDLSEYQLGFALFLKSDGNGLYLTKDLQLLQLKFADPTVKRSIYVVDARQSWHFQQLFQTAKLLGYQQDSYHLAYETVNDEEGKPFSSRKLRGLRIQSLQNQLVQLAKGEYLQKYQEIWPEEEINDTAQKLVQGALKYGMLRADQSSPIHFILKEWLRLDGDTGPYLQYVYARCRKILETFSQELTQSFAVELSHPNEKELIYLLSLFSSTAISSALQYKPHRFAHYLFSIGKAYHKFYETCSIKDAPSESTRRTRLQLVKLCQEAMGTGLQLLGIPLLNRM